MVKLLEEANHKILKLTGEIEAIKALQAGKDQQIKQALEALVEVRSVGFRTLPPTTQGKVQATIAALRGEEYTGLGQRRKHANS